RPFSRTDDFAAILSGVARSADIAVVAQDTGLPATVIADGSQLAVNQGIGDLNAEGSLDGNHRRLVGHVFQARSELVLTVGEPRDDLLAIAGVHHHLESGRPCRQFPFAVPAVNEHVVEYASFGIADQTVADLTRLHVDN